MEVLATMKAYRKSDCGYLGRCEVIFSCDECENLDEFSSNHLKDIAEYLVNKISAKIGKGEFVFELELLDISEDEDESEDEGEDFDDLDEDEACQKFELSLRWFD